MDAEARGRLEAEIRARIDAGALADAATVALRGYGPEILGYLLAIARNDTDARDAFSQFCEDLWRGLGGFRGASTFRTWAYTVARNAHCRLMGEPHRRYAKLELDQAPEIAEIAEAVHTTTMMHRRTSVKERAVQLREQLEPDDRTLLVLRIDRQLSWQEVARVMTQDDAPSDAELARMVVALRKRLERIKQRLRKIAAAPPS